MMLFHNRIATKIDIIRHYFSHFDIILPFEIVIFDIVAVLLHYYMLVSYIMTKVNYKRKGR